jgi:hypothetical protein
MEILFETVSWGNFRLSVGAASRMAVQISWAGRLATADYPSHRGRKISPDRRP